MDIHKNVQLVLVDDDELDLQLLEFFSKKAGFSYKPFLNASEALEYIETLKSPYLVISDISMPKISGFELLKKLKDDDGDAPVVFVSGSGGAENPIQAMRDGAYDFLMKPAKYELFEARVKKAMERVLQKNELCQLQDNLGDGHSIENFIGKSKIVKDIYRTVIQVSSFDATVLITGESGVGKERELELSTRKAIVLKITSLPSTVPLFLIRLSRVNFLVMSKEHLLVPILTK